MSSAGIIKQLLKKTKTEVKGMERSKQAARSKAIKKINILKRSSEQLSVLIPQVAVLANNKIRTAQINNLAQRYQKTYYKALREGDQVSAF